MEKFLKPGISLLLTVMMVLSLTACKGNGGNGGNTDNGSDTNWQEVAKVEKPTYTSGTMSIEDFEKQYRPYTDWRIYEIRTAKNEIKPAEGGTAYYVSNNGKKENDGLTPETAVSTYADVRNKGIKTGDVIYFERGGIWRGTVEITVPGVTITAYGEGKAPQFYLSPENSARKECWIETDKPNVYEYVDKVAGDVGTIVFDDEECAYKSIRSTADQSNSKNKRYVNSYKNLKEDLQMYHDPMTKKVYLFSSEGNPGERYDAIEMVVYGSAIGVTTDNVTIDGVCCKYSNFGIGAGNNGLVKGLTVRNCEFGWIGGSLQGLATQSTTRLGNGIEIWGAAHDFTVENCYFWQVYDAAVTFQYDGDIKNDVKNVKFNNNVFDYCNYSVEYFHRKNGGKVYDFEIKNNLFWYAGEGLCNQRPDHAGVSHIRSGWATNGNAIKVEDNLFAISLKKLASTLDEADIGGAYNNNVYAQYQNRELAANGKNEKDIIKMNKDAASKIETKLGDKNATVIQITK